MNNKLRIFLILIISACIYVSANVIGYAVWNMNQPPVQAEEDGDINADKYVNFTGVTITNTKALKVGVFFFEENETNTETGILQFTITLDRNSLPDEIKNSDFTINSYLSLTTPVYDADHNPINVISGATFDSVTVNNEPIDDDDINIISGRLYAPIDVLSTDTSLVINYVFKQKLVLDYADIIKTNTFDLLITYTKDGE